MPRSVWPYKPTDPRLDTSHPLASKLAAWWPMHEGGGNATGDVVRRVAGTFTGPGTTTWAAGLNGPAVSIDGGSYVSLPSAEYSGWGTGPFSVVVDARCESSARTYQILLSMGGSNTPTGVVAYQLATGQIHYYALAFRISSATGAVTAGRWHQIALTGNGGASGSRSIKLYVDGAQVGSTYVNDYNFAQQELWIGSNQSSGGEYVTGLIGQARAYHRELQAELFALQADPLAGLLGPSRRQPRASAAAPTRPYFYRRYVLGRAA